MTPLTFDPILKRIRWGGTRLGTMLGKPVGPESDYAESWELADHGNDQSIVNSGPFAGKTLSMLVQSHGTEILGRHAGCDQFPLLIKFLDANDWLSLQVHPDDVRAKQYDASENGKTEAWVILTADPGSQICAGLKSGVSRSDFVRHLESETIEECLNLYEVSAGDCVFVPAGTVHAIGAGIVLAEVQQQSDLTFRLHDWGRMGSDGLPRELHVEQSLACIDFDRGPVAPVQPRLLSDGDHRHEELVRAEYFVIERHSGCGAFTIENDNRFHVVMVLDGSIEVAHKSGECHSLQCGSTLLVPASEDRFLITPKDSTTVLDVFLP